MTRTWSAKIFSFMYYTIPQFIPPNLQYFLTVNEITEAAIFKYRLIPLT
jgi:hypothetical protein